MLLPDAHRERVRRAALRHHANFEEQTIRWLGAYIVFDIFMVVIVAYVCFVRGKIRTEMVCATSTGGHCMTEVPQFVHEFLDASVATTNVGWILIFGNLVTFLPAARLDHFLDESRALTITTDDGNVLTIDDFLCVPRRKDGRGIEHCAYRSNRVLVIWSHTMPLCFGWLLSALYYYAKYRVALRKYLQLSNE